tara:strand:- start:132 stop:2066 length:1935 start_codon:yes stop_codon:yes gene_type:complete
MNSLGQNILEQEDMIKGMSDQALQMEMQMPTGRVPEFLILSEIQRRTDMRQRYAGQQNMDMPTVKEQVVADGLAAMAMPVSPVPAAPNSPSPNVPLGDSQQGLAGMGVPMMAKGGKFPDLSGDGKITQKDVLIGKGVITASDGTGLADAMRRSRSTSPEFLGSSFAGPTDYLVQAATSFLLNQGLDPSNYTAQELIEIGRQRMQESRSFLPDSVADDQISTIGDVLEGSKNLMVSALPDFPEMNLGESTADRQRRAGEFADELSRRGDAIKESFTVDIPKSNLGRSARGEGIESAVADIADVGDFVLGQLAPERNAVGSSGQMRRGRNRSDDERSSFIDMLGNIGNIFAGTPLNAVSTEGGEPFDSGDLSAEELQAQLEGIESAQVPIDPAPADARTGSEIFDVGDDFLDATNAILGGAAPDDVFRVLGVDNVSTGSVGGAAKTDLNRSSSIEELMALRDESAGLARTRADEIDDLIQSTRRDAANQAFYAALGQLGAGIAEGKIGEGLSKGIGEVTSRQARQAQMEGALNLKKMEAQDKDIERRASNIAAIANIDLNERKLAAEIAANANLQSRNTTTRQTAVANVVNNIFDPMDYTDELERRTAYTSLYNSLAGAYDVPQLPMPQASQRTRTPQQSISAYDR